MWTPAKIFAVLAVLTVSGLAASAIGMVTTTDAVDHQVVAKVVGKRNSSANLPALADRKISSSLLSTDLTGQSLNTASNAASLTTSSDPTPTLSIDSANPSDFTFTVSGLESDYSGTVKFTDSTGKSDVVSIGSNGTYSANLSNLANGTVTYLMTVSDPAGNVINVDPTATLGDGSANASAGTPQLPNLLSSYAVRPSWEVAGVDYAVGPQPGVTLQNPATINMPGVTLDSTHHWVLITGAGVTLNGYDFTQGGGWTIVIEAPNVTISNFKVGIVAGQTQDPIEIFSPGNNVTLEYGIVDGGGAAGANTNGALISDEYGAGSVTIQYMLLENAVQHSIETDGPNTSALIQYNLFNGAMYAAGMHGDFVQAYSSNTIVQYNTFYQPAAAASGFPGGVVAALNTSLPGNNQTISNIAFDNNTLVGVGSTGHSSGPQAMENWVNWTPTGTGDVVQSPIAENNYATMSGNRSADFAYDESTNFGNLGVTTPTLYNNVNMETGSLLPSLNAP